MTCRDRVRDARVAAGAVRLAAPLRCSLNWLAARHGGAHLPSPLMGDARGERERDPTGESAAGPAGLDHFPQAPRLGTIALRWLSGSGLKSCPRRRLATE